MRHSSRPLLVVLGIWLTAFAFWYWLPISPVSPSVLEELTEVGRSGYHPDKDVPVYVIAGIVAVLVSARLMRHVGDPPADSDSCDKKFVSLQSHRQVSGQPVGWLDLGAILMIGLLVAVVAPQDLVERGFELEGFHHVDFYMMGPLQAFRHGKAIGTDAFAQYGCGWVLVYAMIEQIRHVDYDVFFTTFPLFGVAYFITAYMALRLLTGDPWWSLVGLLVGIWLQLYCGTSAPIWLFPSSTVLRCPFDMLIAIALFKFQSGGGRRWMLLAGSAGGLSVLFGADTGIYILAGLSVVTGLLVLQWLASRDSTRAGADSATVKGPFGNLLLIWGSCFVSMVVGLTLASRGTLADPRFWLGYYEAVLTYGGGFGAMPLQDVIADPLVAVMFLTILCVYTLTLSAAIARASAGRSASRDLMRAFLATVGFGTLIIFVNRSHAFNLFHPILPACWLITGCLADWFPLGRREKFGRELNRKLARPLAATIAVGVIAALVTNENVRDYPSVIGQGLASFRISSTSEPTVRNFTAEIREIGSALRKRIPGNELFIIGEDPTLWLATLDLPPVGRYCPTFPLSRAQEESVLRDVLRTDAQSIVVTRFPSYHGDMIELILKSDFDLDVSADRYAVYVRRSLDKKK